MQDKQEGADVRIHGGVGGAFSGDDGVGWMGQVISLYPYVPLTLCNEEGFEVSYLTERYVAYRMDF